MARINIHIDPSFLATQPRIAKITKTLSERGVFDHIYFVGLAEPERPVYEELDAKRTVVSIHRIAPGPTRPNIIKGLSLLLWSFRAFLFVLPKRVDCINCHRLSLLPFCTLLKGIKGCKLVYDTHELETETAPSKGWRKVLAKVAERIFIHCADQIVVVSESIAEWYRREYGLIKVWTVRSVPETIGVRQVSKSRNLREAFGIQSDETVFLYQGVFGEHRGVKILLDVFMRLDSARHIVFMGFGPLTCLIKQYEARCNNIHYHPHVSQIELPNYTSSADVGINLIENTCLNHYLCLPNKVWEYINAGIPILVSDFPEMARLVNEFDCGWTCSVEREGVRKLIENLSGKNIEEKRTNVQKARGEFGWHVEERTLIALYREITFFRE